MSHRTVLKRKFGASNNYVVHVFLVSRRQARVIAKRLFTSQMEKLHHIRILISTSTNSSKTSGETCDTIRRTHRGDCCKCRDARAIFETKKEKEIAEDKHRRDEVTLVCFYAALCSSCITNSVRRKG